MRDNFDQIMDWLSVYEGGKVDHPKDPGGRTNRGVIQRVYDGYRISKGLGIRDVWRMTDDEHDDIYIEQYWRPIWGDRLPSGVDAAMFDYAVNSGVSRSVKVVQRIVNVKADGVMGLITFGAIESWVEARSAAALVKAICDERMAFLRRLRTFKTFGKGWTRRVMGEQDGYQADDAGVIDRAVALAISQDPFPLPKQPAPGKAEESDSLGILGIIMNIIAAIFGGRRTA